MSIDSSTIVVGNCFVTASGQVRRITEITADGRVGYESRGKSYQKGESSWSFGGPTKDNWPDAATFVSQVERPVACHWDPDYE